MRILIMDDEPYVREGLKKIIDWKEHGFNICAEAIDGNDGYNKIMNLDPDIVFIDMQMPGKLGLDVIKEVKKQNKKAKFIIISGYSNFKYAQKAIKYGVKDYLLKPIDEDELIEVALKLKNEIESENNKNKNLKINNIELKQYILEQIMLGKNVQGHEEIKASFKNKTFQVALISNSLNKINFDNILKVEKLLSEISSYLDSMYIVKVGDRIALIMQDLNVNHYKKLLNKFKNKIDSEIGGNTFIALGEEVDNIEKISLSYRNAKKITSNQFLFYDFGVVSNQEVENKINNTSYDEAELFRKIYNYVEIGEVSKLKEKLVMLENMLRTNMYSEEHIKIIITKNLLEFKNKIKKDYSLSEEDINSDGNGNIIDQIYAKDNLKSVIEFLIEYLTIIANKINISTSDNSIKRIIKYIEKNYYSDLKLELLAEIFNYNSAYLGKIFKSNTGEGFNIFLDKIRIEKAKKLLVEEKLKVYEVCEMVGYKNIDYFHSKFKRYVGVSPLNYKKQMEGESKKYVLKVK